jgi:transcription initiation factor TFIIE subunit alpha
MRKLTDSDLDLLTVAYKLTGVEGYAVLQYIAQNSESTDDELSRAFKVKPNVIRQIIYNLERNDLVVFRKTVDLKTNWVTFYWKANKDFFRTHVEYRRNKIVEKIKKRYEHEKNHSFFSCPNKCVRIVFDEAFEGGFRCQKCNEILVMEDNGELIKFLGNVLASTLRPEKEHLPRRHKKTR